MPSTLQPVGHIPPLTDDEKHLARQRCAHNATDATELATFLSMLGLEEGQ